MDTGINQILPILIFSDNIIMIETVERKSFAFLSTQYTLSDRFYVHLVIDAVFIDDT